MLGTSLGLYSSEVSVEFRRRLRQKTGSKLPGAHRPHPGGLRSILKKTLCCVTAAPTQTCCSLFRILPTQRNSGASLSNYCSHFLASVRRCPLRIMMSSLMVSVGPLEFVSRAEVTWSCASQRLLCSSHDDLRRRHLLKIFFWLKLKSTESAVLTFNSTSNYFSLFLQCGVCVYVAIWCL